MITMDYHRLKVVKFDRPEENSNSIVVIGDVAKETHYIITNECNKYKEEPKKVIHNKETEKIQRPFIVHKCRSEPLKVIRKEKCFGKHVRKKTISFDEIKRNFISKHNLFKPPRLPKLINGKKMPKRNKEIKVLFASEVSRLTKKDRNVCCLTKRRNTKVGTLPERSKTSYDIFGFQNRKCSFDSISKQYRCDKGCITNKFNKLQSKLNKINKLSQPKNKPKPFSERQPLKFLKAHSSKLRLIKSESNCCKCTTAQHYNLVCFPENNPTLRRKAVSQKHVPVYPAAYFRDCTCKDQQVSVTPSRLQVRKKPVGEAAVATSCSLCHNCTEPARVNKSSRSLFRPGKISKSTRRGRNLCRTFLGINKILPKKHCRSHNSKIRTILKSILMALVIVAWIPCIITVSLCWILTYPLRPQYIQTNACENVKCSHKRTPLSQIMKAVKCLADKTAYSIKAILSLVCKDGEGGLQHVRNTFPHSSPDPKKKYTLFYTDHRGWRMKQICEENFGEYDRNNQILKDPTYKTAQDKNRNIVKHRCYGCKLHKVAKNVNIDTLQYHHATKFKNQSQNTKLCERTLYERPERLNNKGKYPVIRPRIRSKSHPLPNGFNLMPHGRKPDKFSPCLRTIQSSPVPLNNIAPNRKRKSRFTRHLPNCCGPCELKRYKMPAKLAKQMNYSCKINHRYKGVKHWKKEKSYFKRLWNFIRGSFKKLERIIDETEDVAWKDEIKCDMYLETLREKPCPWLYRRCPSIYPCVAVWVKCIKSTWNMAVYTLSFCVWCPVMCGCYIFSEMFWKCLK